MLQLELHMYMSSRGTGSLGLLSLFWTQGAFWPVQRLPCLGSLRTSLRSPAWPKVWADSGHGQLDPRMLRW